MWYYPKNTQGHKKKGIRNNIQGDQGYTEMSSPGKIHLYTIWNHIVCSNTIEQHEDVRLMEGTVKWLVLYDEDIWVAEKNIPINLRAFLHKSIIFENSLLHSYIACLIAWPRQTSLLNLPSPLKAFDGHIFRQALHVGGHGCFLMMGSPGMEASVTTAANLRSAP